MADPNQKIAEEAAASGDWIRAARAWLRAFAHADTLSPGAYASASIAHRKLGEFVTAEERALEGITAHPEAAAPAMEYADAAFFRGMFDEALARWTMAINQFGGAHPEVFLRAATTLRACNDPGFALEVLEEGAERHPGDEQIESLLTVVRREAALADAHASPDFLEPISVGRNQNGAVAFSLSDLPPIVGIDPQINAPDNNAAERYLKRIRGRTYPVVCEVKEVGPAYYFAPAGVLLDGSGRILDGYASNEPVFHERILPAFRTSTLKHLEGDTYIFTRRGEENYFHWTVEMLPMLSLADHFDRHGIKATTLLVNPGRMQNEWIDYLSQEGLQTSRIERVHCRMPALFSMDRAFYPQYPEAYTITSWGREFLARLANHARGQAKPARRILSLRGSSRVRDEDRLAAFFQARGFEPVNNSSLSVREQVELYSQASAVAGIHGANLVNASLMLPGSQFIEIMPSGRMDITMQGVSSALGLDHRVIIQQTDDGTITVTDELLRQIDAVLSTERAADR
ncbi:MAG: glycosyltransferase 61 family protein [Pseudomonadota bacterium]